MRHLAGQIEAIVFDYGNTLIEFGPDQVERCDRALSAELSVMFGPHDFETLNAIQHEERRAPYSGEFLEHDLAEVTGALVRKLFDTQADAAQIERLLEVRFEAMTSSVSVEQEVHDLLERLMSRFQLGLVSNYPCSRSINHSLAEHEMDRWFEAVVVSGDVGRVKPHPSLFENIVTQMKIDPQSTLFVGDNWLGDIQGAKRFGMKAAWTTQYVPYESFDREPDHHDADVVIEHLSELADLLVDVEENE